MIGFTDAIRLPEAYTDESVQALKAALNADEQASVDAMTKAINDAIAGLQKKQTKPDPTPTPEPSTKEDGLANEAAANGNWYYYIDGQVATGVTTVVQNEYGWWYVKNGQIDFSHTGYVTWYGTTYKVQNGKVAWEVKSN